MNERCRAVLLLVLVLAMGCSGATKWIEICNGDSDCETGDTGLTCQVVPGENYSSCQPPKSAALAGLKLVRSGFVVLMGPGAIEAWGKTSRSDAGAIVPGLKRR